MAQRETKPIIFQPCVVGGRGAKQFLGYVADYGDCPQGGTWVEVAFTHIHPDVRSGSRYDRKNVILVPIRG